MIPSSTIAHGFTHDTPTTWRNGCLASAVTVIDTSNNEVSGTTDRLWAKDIEVAVDGRVYAIDEDWYYPDVNVYDRDMLQDPYSIPLTSYTGSAYAIPTTLAISTDGKHAFLGRVPAPV